MNDNTRSCLAFLVVVAFMCLIAWLGGYNFDRRDEGVAAYGLMTLVLASGVAILIRGDW